MKRIIAIIGVIGIITAGVVFAQGNNGVSETAQTAETPVAEMVAVNTATVDNAGSTVESKTIKTEQQCPESVTAKVMFEGTGNTGNTRITKKVKPKICFEISKTSASSEDIPVFFFKDEKDNIHLRDTYKLFVDDITNNIIITYYSNENKEQHVFIYSQNGKLIKVIKNVDGDLFGCEAIYKNELIILYSYGDKKGIEIDRYYNTRKSNLSLDDFRNMHDHKQLLQLRFVRDGHKVVGTEIYNIENGKVITRMQEIVFDGGYAPWHELSVLRSEETFCCVVARIRDQKGITDSSAALGIVEVGPSGDILKKFNLKQYNVKVFTSSSMFDNLLAVDDEGDVYQLWFGDGKMVLLKWSLK